MTENDLIYAKKAIEDGLITSPCLEVGSGLKGHSIKDILVGSGLECYGTDIVSGPAVDFVADLGNEDVVKNVFGDKRFNTILVFNVLEHVFDPIRFLDNCLRLLNDGGTCVIVTPCVWTLHSYPSDYWRINPDFYEEYARMRGLQIIDGSFRYLGYGEINKGIALPYPSQNKIRIFYSRAIHRIFNTFGRLMYFSSHIAIGVVYRKNQKPVHNKLN